MTYLKVEIRRGGKVLQVVKLLDPRASFCRQFNADTEQTSQGLRAYPVSSDTRRARSKSREA